MTKPLLVAALKDEVRPLQSKMVIDATIHFKPATLYRGQFQNKEVDLLVTGIGRARVEKGLEQALSLATPSLILCVGYAGGASPVAGTGTLVLAERVVEEKSGTILPAEEGLLKRAKELCEKGSISYQIGGVVTVEKVIHLPHEKADMGVTNRSIAIDMEGAVVARVASERKIPWLVVKAVLDPMEMVVPSLEDCVEETGEANPMKLMEHVLRTPKDLMQLPALQYQASQARGAIHQFLEKWI